ncbi:hypothetical protein ATANTOWER_000887 [Ataeniobius toweri]|uniref:Uncharacterized protein n=1 Tax=Ataeniobius toweri TaxID=208326 RepID=A0ABU7BLM4_9TELE|nr:hypothetical protein [Ataeniobius toweri]
MGNGGGVGGLGAMKDCLYFKYLRHTRRKDKKESMKKAWLSFIIGEVQISSLHFMAICQVVCNVSFERSLLPPSMTSLGLNVGRLVPFFVKFGLLTLFSV